MPSCLRCLQGRANPAAARCVRLCGSGWRWGAAVSPSNGKGKAAGSTRLAPFGVSAIRSSRFPHSLSNSFSFEGSHRCSGPAAHSRKHRVPAASPDFLQRAAQPPGRPQSRLASQPHFCGTSVCLLVVGGSEQCTCLDAECALSTARKAFLHCRRSIIPVTSEITA